jgi:hypothetical protein
LPWYFFFSGTKQIKKNTSTRFFPNRPEKSRPVHETDFLGPDPTFHFLNKHSTLLYLPEIHGPALLGLYCPPLKPLLPT